MCSGDEGAVEREANVTSLEQLDDFVLFAFVFQLHQVLIIEGGLGILVDVEVDFVADFCDDIELYILVEVEIGGVLLGDGGIATVVVLDAKGEVNRALGTNVDGVAAKDEVESLSANIQRRDDGVAVLGGTGVLLLAGLPVFLYPLAVLVIKIVFLRHCGGDLVLKIAYLVLEGVLTSDGIVYHLVGDVGWHM